jgi:hypothetical protein
MIRTRPSSVYLVQLLYYRHDTGTSYGSLETPHNYTTQGLLNVPARSKIYLPTVVKRDLYGIFECPSHTTFYTGGQGI